MAPVRDTQPAGSRLASYKRSRQPQRTSEERYQLQQLAAIIANAGDAIIGKNLDGVILSWNTGAERMYGYSAEEMIGRSVDILIPLDRAGEAQRLMERIQTGERIDHFETERMHKDGHRVLVSLAFYGIRNPEGKLTGIASIARDISGHKAMERKLAQSEEDLRRSKEQIDIILRGIADGIVVLDAAGRLVYVNDAAVRMGRFASQEEMLSIPPEELATRFEFFDEHGRPLAPETLPSARALQGESGDMTVQYRIKRTGEIRWTTIAASPVLHPSGRVQFAVNIFHDITDERVEQENLRRREEQYRSLAEAIPNIVFTATPDGVVDYYNARWYDYTGLSPEESLLLGESVVLHPDDEQLCQERWENAIQTGVPYEIEYRLRRARDGVYRWHLGRAVPLRDDGGRIVKWFGTCTDIDDRKQTEERAQKLNEILERRVRERTAELHALNESLAREIAERIRAEEKEKRIDATKSEFMSLASHQLRTPLTAIRWALGRLERMLGSRTAAEPSLRLVNEAHAAAVRMTETINTMLAISRIEAGKTTIQHADVSLHALLDGLREQYRTNTERRGQSLHVRCPAFLTLSTDPFFLKEILQNLLSNSIKYTPEHGVIVVTAQSEDGGIRLDIQDSGYGIPAHQQDRIFTKFFRGDNVVDKETDGTGLGLYLVYLLTGMIGGTIAFTSTEGKGTTFTLHLPSAAKKP